MLYYHYVILRRISRVITKYFNPFVLKDINDAKKQDCPAPYIGGTGRNFEIRQKEKNGNVSNGTFILFIA